jgi:hypothetical protein
VSQPPGESDPRSSENVVPAPETATPSSITSAAAGAQDKPQGLGAKLKRFFLGGKIDKERMKALGKHPGMLLVL